MMHYMCNSVFVLPCSYA
uniref:Uncharacterized protein n=1 Tax=Arundo donax TaxID=35708 RepID=A0A0A9BWZ7_ARUDO